VVDDDAVNFVGHIFEGVRHPLEVLEHFAVDRELHRVALRELLESPLKTARMDIVGVPF